MTDDLPHEVVELRRCWRHDLACCPGQYNFSRVASWRNTKTHRQAGLPRISRTCDLSDHPKPATEYYLKTGHLYNEAQNDVIFIKYLN